TKDALWDDAIGVPRSGHQKSVIAADLGPRLDRDDPQADCLRQPGHLAADAAVASHHHREAAKAATQNRRLVVRPSPGPLEAAPRLGVLRRLENGPHHVLCHGRGVDTPGVGEDYAWWDPPDQALDARGRRLEPAQAWRRPRKIAGDQHLEL